MGGGLRLEPGPVAGGRFVLRRPIGEGGMGWVWEAADGETGGRVALKFLKSEKEGDRRRFLREVRAAAAVRHPNVVAMHEVLELDDGDRTLVMVMDLLEGESLGSVLRRLGRVPLPALAAVLLPVVSALEAAHAAGIVHRDLKPDNIFLARSPAEASTRVCVLDFGVAKLTASEGLAAQTEALTGTGSMIGTPYYMSPEQVESEKDLDARADIWSLGVLAYECLSGVRPTEAETVGRVLKRILMADFPPIQARCPDLPEAVASLIQRMLIGDREQRLSDLKEITAVLSPHAGSIPAPAPAPHDAVDPAHASTVRAASAPRTKPPDTHSAVAVATRPAWRRSGTRITAVAAAFTLAGAIAAWRRAPPAAPPTPPALAASPPALTPSLLTVPAPSASASTPLATAPSAAPAPRPSTPGPSAVATTSSTVHAVTSPSPSPSPPAASSLAAPPKCAPSETASRGHCCPRGLEWQGAQCERPLATSF